MGKYIASVSFGKDSLAMLLYILENKLPLDEVVFYDTGMEFQAIYDVRGKYSTIIREGSTIHSKKPRAAYEMLEDMFPDASKIELFARNTRDGWDGFGDELEVSNGTDTR